MGVFTKEEADEMGAFEETALDAVDAHAAEVSLPDNSSVTVVPAVPGTAGGGQ